jgi:hypothetical protein
LLCVGGIQAFYLSVVEGDIVKGGKACKDKVLGAVVKKP